MLCGSDPGSIQGVFSQYGRLTRRSGLELNTEKTKILNLHSDRELYYNMNYNRILGANRLLLLKLMTIKWFSHPTAVSSFR